ncbi:zinc ribbon domain-containing protein [Streptomyces sp. HNM0574]|nr:zinc ribbon domain-containing protein [Streptomyces sp. HNM0574]
MNCPECGVRAEPGQSFCDSCGAVLGWTSAGTAGIAELAEAEGPQRTPGGAAGPPEPSGPAGNPEPDGEPGRPGTPPVPPEAGPGDAAGAPLGPPAGPLDAPGSQPPEPAPPADRAPQAPPRQAPPAHPDDTAARARSLLVPVEEPDPPQAPQPSVAPVLPGRPDADRPQVRAPAGESGERGGTPCPWCATPNRPDRHFCGRCAMPMTRREEAPPEAPLPWWRRLFGRDGRETPWAGDRPRLRRGFGRVLNWVVGVLVLALVAVAVLNAPAAYHAVRDHFAKRAPVQPNSVAASRSYSGHDPQLLFDKRNDTWWGPGVTKSAEGEWVEAHFDRPPRLLDVIITPGTSAKADELSKSALPQEVEATVTKADGKKETHRLTLDQAAGGQLRSFQVGSASAVRLTVRSSYGATDNKQLAIAEVEFFGPSSGSSS